jgi:hypothetical protein
MDSSLVPVIDGTVVTGRILDGPVRLWYAVTDASGMIMGAAAMPEAMPWQWRDGHLCLVYTGLRVVMTRPGWYAYGVICAVSESEQAAPFVPVWKVGLGESRELRAGDDLVVADGMIGIIPDFPVHSGPFGGPGPG